MRAGRAQQQPEPPDGHANVVEAGFTLVEVLISLTILSLAIFTVVGGMNVLVISSAVNRKQGNVATVATRAAEAVRADAYVTCASLTASSYPLNMPASAAQLPENQIANRVQLPFVVKVTNLAGTQVLWNSATPGSVNCTGVGASDLQIVQVEDDSVGSASAGGSQALIKEQLNVVKS